MFELRRLRTSRLDQLQPCRLYELRKDAWTLEREICHAGAEFRFEFALVDTTTGDAEIHGFAANNHPVIFETRGDAHRMLFADTGREWQPEAAPAPAGAPAAEPAVGEEAMWLAMQPGFERAAAIMAGERSSGHWNASRDDADVLRAAALALAADHPTAARWIAGQSVILYYTWTSQATSGGEGTAMQAEVSRELAQLRRLIGKTSPL